LCRDGFAKSLIALVDESGLAPRQVCIEITERQEISAPEKASAATAILRKTGFRVAIDDAGTGHNGLAAIQMLDASTLKIDKFFVDHIAHDTRSTMMIDMLVSMAERFGMKTVAEGVETQDQVDVLRQAGVDYIQGFVYARPVPANGFVSALNAEWQHFGDQRTDAPAQLNPPSGIENSRPLIPVGAAATA
jgi:EAL domain-containing protein (putative c-di-GMP-specific phosphodiesterase class I)